MSENQIVKQAVVVTQGAPKVNQQMEKIALFNEAGSPALALTFETLPTGDDVLLTGYVSGDVVDVESTDTVNEAIAKVEAKADTPDSGAEVILTGYVLGSAVDIAATDTVNQALGKVQALLYNLISRVEALEA
jgi:hypothetical protein